MAYVAVISLKHTIRRLLDSSRISILPSTREILQSAYHEVDYLQQILKRSDDSSSSSKRLTSLDGQIKEAAQNLENSLEFPQSNHFLSRSANEAIDMAEVKAEIISFVDTMKDLEEEYIKEIDNPWAEEEDDDDEAYVPSSSFDFVVKNVGLSDDFNKIQSQVLRRMRPYDFIVCPIIGRIGSGRSVIARAVFEDLFIGQEQTFDCGAWVTVGPNYRIKEILLSIAAQIDPDRSHIPSEGDDEQNIGEVIFASLVDRKYMIALDDIRDEELFEYLKWFPGQDNGSLILLTTDLHSVRELDTILFSFQYCEMDKNWAWDMLELMIFGVMLSVCPPELEKAGKKIVDNCQCCPIAFFRVLLHLWKAEKTPEYWNNLAADDKNPMFAVVDEISEICQVKEEIRQLSNLNFNDDQISVIINLLLQNVNIPTAIKAKQIKMDLFPERCFPKMEIISICGMAGIGKTTLVKQIFEDPIIMCNIEHRVWMTLGPKYQPEEVLVDILAQVYPNIDKRHMKSDTKLTKDLCKKLSCKRCLIVLDDIWSKKPLHHLEKLFPDINGKALVTTRLIEVARFEKSGEVHEMHFLDIEESWLLFCQKVFNEWWCPPELENVGKKICDKCEGLPLLILMVADLLSRDDKTLEYWNKIANQEKNPIFTAALNEISKVLIPSYKTLPQYLKACFLYMGVFPHDYEIITAKLIALLISEGFLEPNSYQNEEDFIAECLSELSKRSLIIVCQKGSNFKSKAYRLHYVFWHLSNIKAMKTGFFYALSTSADNSIECITSQRRLCIRNNILLGLEDIQNSMTSASNAHSLLCTGPPHQYQVPICFNSRLLRVLDAITIRIYEFPIEVVKLIHLRYLALTCNGKIPASISKLLNLQYLIVSRYLSIKSSNNDSYLPVEIWDMKELKHVQITGGCMSTPHNGSSLPNLVTLLDVSAHSCTKSVFTSVPNLKRLRIQIELSPNDNDDDDCTLFRCLDYIFHLERLESLTCNVVNPELRFKVVVPFIPHSMFPRIIKLSLSGLGYPWSHMRIIGELPNLEVLKLRCFAFRGPKWQVDYYVFNELKFLSIEDTDLECWEVKFGAFQNLEHLSIKHCYKLKKLPQYLYKYSMKVIEIIDCNPTIVSWVNRIKEDHDVETLKVQSSWNAVSAHQQYYDRQFGS